MSVTATRVDRVIAADLAVRLKNETYRKSGRTFFRAGADHTRVVNVQGNKWNDGHEGTFAINLGVYFPAVAELGGGPVARGAFPKENECSITTRLAAPGGSGSHEWWALPPSDDVAHVAVLVGNAWTDVGRPWIEQASTLHGAYDVICTQGLHFLAAIFALALGEREEATAHLNTAIARLPRGRERFEEWGERHRLRITDSG
jgi:hypothetical protein